MKKVLSLTAVIEAATGVALLIVPSLVGRLLFGEEFTGIVIPVARVLGIALIALGVGCLPGSTALCGMLTDHSPLDVSLFTERAPAAKWLGVPIEALAV